MLELDRLAAASHMDTESRRGRQASDGKQPGENLESGLSKPCC